MKIIRAQGLRKSEWGSSNPYVILCSGAAEIARTRVIDHNLDPVWSEAFKVGLPGYIPDAEAVVSFTVYTRNELMADEILGSSSLALRDPILDDFLTHDIIKDLIPQGKLFLRVRKGGEKDNILFWVSRAMETLQFALEDMIRVYIDQVTNQFFKRMTDSLAFRFYPHFFSFFCCTSKNLE